MPETHIKYTPRQLSESVQQQLAHLCREYENWMSSSILANNSSIRELANRVEVGYPCSHIESLRLVRMEIERAAVEQVARS